MSPFLAPALPPRPSPSHLGNQCPPPPLVTSSTRGPIALSWCVAACLNTQTVNSMPCCFSRALLPGPYRHSWMVRRLAGNRLAAATDLTNSDISLERTGGGGGGNTQQQVGHGH